MKNQDKKELDKPLDPPVSETKVKEQAEITLPKEVITIKPRPKLDQLHEELTAIMADRFESDIPLNDPYWKKRKEIHEYMYGEE